LLQLAERVKRGVKMVTIKVFTSTPTWPSCEDAAKAVLKVAKKFPVGEVEVKKYESLSPEGKKAGILLTPTVIINEKVVSAGRSLSEKDYEKLIKTAQGANN
jgi:hypothetical protein